MNNTFYFLRHGETMNYPALTGRGINVSYAAFQSNSVAV
jgi:broad specificity phosphatase PhoE